MFRRRPPPVQVGDRFVKVGDRTGKVWEISRLWTTVDDVPHARLVYRDETLAVSVGTLADTEFFLPASTWMQEHIKKDDKALSSFLREKRVA